jgi:hypothetical protein
MFTNLNNNIKEHWRVHTKNFFMSFFHWKSHAVAYMLSGSGRHRNPPTVAKGPLFHPYPAVNLDQYFPHIPFMVVDPAVVLIVPVDPWVDRYPRDPWNNLNDPNSLKLYVKNLVSDLFPVPHPVTGMYPTLKNLQSQYTFFRGFSNEDTSEIPNYEHFLETWRAVLSPNVGMQLALDMQENRAIRYLPALLWNAVQVETRGSERSWRHVETTDTGIDIYEEGSILVVGSYIK